MESSLDSWCISSAFWFAAQCFHTWCFTPVFTKDSQNWKPLLTSSPEKCNPMEYVPAGRCLLPARREFGVRHQGLSQSTWSHDQNLTTAYTPTVAKLLPAPLPGALLLMNNLKTDWHCSSLTLKCQASNCGRSWNASWAGRGSLDRGLRWYLVHPSTIPCSPLWVMTLRAAILCLLRKRKWIFLNYIMDVLFIFFFCFTFLVALTQRSLGKLDKRKKKKRFSSKFKILVSSEAELHLWLQLRCLWLSCPVAILLLCSVIPMEQEHPSLLHVSLDCHCFGRRTASPCVFAYCLGQGVLATARTGDNVV